MLTDYKCLEVQVLSSAPIPLDTSLVNLGAVEEFPQRAQAGQDQHNQQQQFGLVMRKAVQNVAIYGTTGNHNGFTLKAIIIWWHAGFQCAFWLA